MIKNKGGKMKNSVKIKIGEEFKPSPKLKKVYRIYLISLIIIGILSWLFLL